MKADHRVYIGIVGLIFVGLVLLEMTRPQPLDWEKSYSKDREHPFGCELLYQNLNDLFPGQEIRTGEQTLYRAEQEGDLNDATIIMIGEEIELSSEDRDLLLERVREGAKVFIAARSIDRSLLDSLRVSMDHHFPWEGTEEGEPEDDTIFMNLKKPNTPDRGYPFSKGLASAHFDRMDLVNSEPLGYSESRKLVFLRAGFRDGAFFLHSRPLAFTNYYLAQDASFPYAFKAFSHLPPDDIYWDEYYKPQSERLGKNDPDHTPLRFLLQNPPLRAGLYTLLIGIFLLLTFGSKRRQRAMSVIHSPSNSTLSYVEVLGRLYFEDGGHQRIGKMRAQQFLWRIRQRTGIEVKEPGYRGSIEKVAAATGKDEKDVEKAFLFAQEALERKKGSGQKRLLEFERAIAAFWKNRGRSG